MYASSNTKLTILYIIGMRGCVTAGMVSAIYYLGLEDTFDVIYGSSAGTVIGAYFNTRYDVRCTMQVMNT